MKDVMVDIETLGTGSNSVIVSISAVVFGLASGKVGSTFEVGIDLLPQLLEGADLDKETLAWWKTQSAEAKKSLIRITPEPIEDALGAFNKWLVQLDYAPKDIKLWGNGSNFDNVIIRNLYKRSNINFILPYWCDNDVRTLVNISGINTRDFDFKGIKHNGIHDCKHQINYCIAAYKSLK